MKAHVEITRENAVDLLYAALSLKQFDELCEALPVESADLYRELWLHVAEFILGGVAQEGGENEPAD